MEFSLRCNSLKCRNCLTDQAVVTTCSHIFCVPCSESSGLARPNGNIRVCPACETQLLNPDDAVITQLNPTEDYKTSVLSGLNPTIIMECAGRALSFYSYQSTQEIIYQEYLARSLTEKYSVLSGQMDQVINEANTEITKLRTKIEDMSLERQTLGQKCDKLAESCREKEKAKQTYQTMYNRLKQQHAAADMEIAADDNAQHVLEAAQHDSANHRNGHSKPAGPRSNGSGWSGRRPRQATPLQGLVQGSRNGLQSARNGVLAPTPSGHRTRLPGPVHNNGSSGNAVGSVPHRSVLQNIDPNVHGNSNHGLHGGFSAGAKFGRQQYPRINRNGFENGRLSRLGGNVR